MADVTPVTNSRQTLSTLRFLWAASLGGQVVFLAVALVVSLGGYLEADEAVARIVSFVSVAMLAVLAPAAYFVRNQIYKRHWQGLAITPRGYSTGNIAFFAMLEAAVLTATVAVLLGGLTSPAWLVALTGKALVAINFPTGRAMQPTQPHLGQTKA